MYLIHVAMKENVHVILFKKWKPKDMVDLCTAEINVPLDGYIYMYTVIYIYVYTKSDENWCGCGGFKIKAQICLGVLNKFRYKHPSFCGIHQTVGIFYVEMLHLITRVYNSVLTSSDSIPLPVVPIGVCRSRPTGVPVRVFPAPFLPPSLTCKKTFVKYYV